MSNELPYVVEPNRLTSSGAQTLDAIGLLLVVDPDELRMEVRTGPTTDREISVEYDRIRDVTLTDGVTPDLEIETRRTEYVVTGIADSLQRARRIADAVARLAGVDTERRPGESAVGSANTPPAQTGGDQSDQQASMLEMETATPEYPQRVHPSETFSCPTCDQTVEVPGQLPEQTVDVNCPGCDTVLGRVGDDRESIIIDPDT